MKKNKDVSNKYKLTIFFVVFILVWVPIHEFTHYFVARMMGWGATIHWTLPIPTTNVTFPLISTTTVQIALFNLAPYILGLIVIISYFIKRNSILRWLSHFAILDIIGNLVMFFYKVNDFKNIVFLTNPNHILLSIIVLSLSFLFWYKSHEKEDVILIKEYFKSITKQA